MIWFTVQVTDSFVVPLTVALYCTDVPMVAVAGPVSVTVMVAGGVVPLPVGLPMLFEPQPARRAIPAMAAVETTCLKLTIIPMHPDPLVVVIAAYAG